MFFGCGVCDCLLGMTVGYLIRTRQKFGFPFVLFSIFLKLFRVTRDLCVIKTYLQIFSQQCAHRALNYVILTLINSSSLTCLQIYLKPRASCFRGQSLETSQMQSTGQGELALLEIIPIYLLGHTPRHAGSY